MIFDLAKPPTDSREVDLGHGVTATLRPWTGALAATAEATTTHELRLLQEGVGVERYGIELGDWPENAGSELVLGLALFIDTAVRAALQLEAWNLVDAEGEPIPISTLTVSRLFHRGITGASGHEHMRAYNEQAGT